MNSPIKNPNKVFTSAEIIFDGIVTNESLEQGVGSITLKCDDREYILDVVSSLWFTGLGRCESLVELAIETDIESFPECKYDLTEIDLYSSNLTGTIFIGQVDDILISATLWVKLGQTTKAINLTLE